MSPDTQTSRTARVASARQVLIAALAVCTALLIAQGAHAGWDEVRFDPQAQWVTDRSNESEKVIALASPIFRLTVDRARGGEVTGLELFDGATWRSVLGEDGQLFPAFRLLLEGETEPLVPHDVTLQRQNITERCADLVYVAQMHTAKGQPSGLTLSYHYEIFPEGAMFIRLGLTGWPVAQMTDASVTLELDRSASGAVRFRDEQLAKETPALPSARAAFGWEPERSYTNELELQIENKQGIDGDITYAATPGRYTWQLISREAQDNATLDTVEELDTNDVRKAPTLYYNRIALGMTNSPYASSRSNCLGERIYHWVNFLDLSPENWHPTDTELADMVDKGATMVILHHEYMDQRGSNGSPPADYTVLRDDAEFRRCLSTAERLGLRVGVYLRGVEPYALDDARIQSLIEEGVDGFYIDWHGAQATSFHESRTAPAASLGDRHYSDDGSVVPAREYFRYIQRLREIVDPDGFIIGHLGSFNSGVLANVGIDGFVAGETTSEWALFDSREDAVYRGMMAGAVVMPWPEEAEAFNERQSLAKMAAWGFYPHLLMGIDKPRTGLFPRDPGSDQYQTVSPYWQLLRKLGSMRGVHVLNLPADANIVATTDNEYTRVVVYQQPEGELLVLVANMSDQSLNTAFQLDPEILPPAPAQWFLIGPDHVQPTALKLNPDQSGTSVPVNPGGITGVLIQQISDLEDEPRSALHSKELP